MSSAPRAADRRRPAGDRGPRPRDGGRDDDVVPGRERPLLQHLGPVLAPLGGARTTSVGARLHDGGRAAAHARGARGGRGVGQAGPHAGDDEHGRPRRGRAPRGGRPGQRRRASRWRPTCRSICAIPATSHAVRAFLGGGPPLPGEIDALGRRHRRRRGGRRAAVRLRRVGLRRVRRGVARLAVRRRLPAHGARCRTCSAPGRACPATGCARARTARPLPPHDRSPRAVLARRPNHLSGDTRPTPALRRRAGRYAQPPVRYPGDDLTAAERERLAPHFTNLDGPVFALVNLPETVKGALFARYSRYPGTLRRLFLEEFADSLPEPPAGYDQGEGKRAAELYERIFVGYGDDSVAQLGGAHVACEWISNILTKILQRPRLARLPRAVDALHRLRRADARAAATATTATRRSAPSTRRRWTRCSTTTREALPRVRAWVDETFPRAGGRAGRRAPPRGQRQGARPAARPAARGLALAHGHLRHRPGLRAADPAPARPPAAGGAPLRRADPRRRSRP